MSTNALFASVMIVLAVAAMALRIAMGPIVQLEDGDTLYALAKSAPPAGFAAEVELAASSARPAR